MDEKVLVYRGSQIHAEMAREILEQNEIPSLLTSEHGAGFVMRAGGLLEDYFLYVRPDQAEKAIELVAVVEGDTAVDPCK
ncbi:MAG: hypothetical protein GX291_00215 [Tissierellia bacterium]|jgi:hypothetical protein|nr:hypothetical protein [Tissierellia bacterium]